MLPFNDLADFSLPIVFGYAEIHYHFKYLYPRYFRREPEIIADVPIRCIKEITSKLPILIIIKDAHLFPISLNEIEVQIHGNENEGKYTFPIDKQISAKYFSHILELDLDEFDVEQVLRINVEIQYRIKNEVKIALNDNYPHLNKQPFRCYFAEKKLPFSIYWFPGEPHYHSIHTSDQVEFGADIESTKVMAKAMGLKWFFVTDHSYDLDDCGNDYTKNDPELPIWKKMQENAQKADEADFRVIPGEEISIGNSNARNIHLLAINHPEFIEGSGDSAERWFRNKPQHLMTEIKQKHTDENLFIAAHPFEKVPFIQKLTLGRGNWLTEDYENGGIKFLQVINSAIPADIQYSISEWIRLLLKGNKFFIVAGNDAHGNFNVMRQIKSPFWKLFRSEKQTFGKFFTAFQLDSNDPITGIKSGNMIVSNGPFLNFKLKIGIEEFQIGSALKSERAELHYETASTLEFGEISEIKLFIGDYESEEENEFSKIENGEILDLNKPGYVRMSLKTVKGGMAFTNPLWID